MLTLPCPNQAKEYMYHCVEMDTIVAILYNVQFDFNNEIAKASIKYLENSIKNLCYTWHLHGSVLTVFNGNKRPSL